MVTNSFGKRNFMQPIGRPKHALKVPCFFSFQVWQGRRGGGREVFPFLLSSQCVPTMFLLSSQWVAISFPICSPTCSPWHLTFIPYAKANVVLLSPIKVGQRGGTLHFKINLPFWGPSSFFE